MAGENAKRQFIKECLFSALMILMKQKKLEDITITKLTEKAGVSRMAFYRNYHSMTDIIVEYLEEHPFGFRENLTCENFDLQQQVHDTFSYLLDNKTLINNLVSANLTYLFMNLLDKYFRGKYLPIINSLGFKDSYEVSAVVGICYKIVVDWAIGGMKEDIDDMAIHAFNILSIYRDAKRISTGKSFSGYGTQNYAKPKDAGEHKSWDACGEFGVAHTGDKISLFMLVHNETITRVRVKIQGIPAIAAAASAATRLAEGKTLTAARSITKEDICEAIGGLPEDKLYFAAVAEGAIKAAVLNYYNRQSLGIVNKTNR